MRLAAALTVLAVTTAARAEEGGAGHYAPGAFASFADVLPAQPGFVTFNYFTYYDGNGSLHHQFPIAGQLALKLGTTYCVDTVGAFWVTPLRVLGANFALGLSLPFMKTSITMSMTHPAGETVGRSGSASGLGDIEFWPVALSWGAMGGDLHVEFLGGIYAPSGGYEANRLANPGLGYWTFEPGVLVSYLGQKSGFEFTTYVGYDINSANHATDYRGGQEFHVDATVARHLALGKGLIGIGANAFYLKQTTPDSGGGAVLGSFEEMTSGIGPVLSYATQLKKVGLVAELKWLPQLSAEKTPKGDYVWLKVGVQF